MATVEQPVSEAIPLSVPPPIAIAPHSALTTDSHVVLHNISWQTYEELRANEANWGVRMTFDKGVLVMMTPSRRHERFSSLLHQLIYITAVELNIPIDSCGSTTWSRSDLAAGLEPDECFYIQNEAAVRERDDLDLTVDPPPDLAIEVEVTRSAASKMHVYAGLRVPEVWRYDGTRLQVLQLSKDGQYSTQPRSACFPMLPIDGLEQFLNQRASMDVVTLTNSYLAWLRELIAKAKGKD